MAETFNEYLSRVSSERDARTAAAAQLVIGSVEDQPDALAGDLNLANDFAKITGNPVPPAPLVKEYRNVFQQKIEEAKNATVLSRSPKLSDWLRDPENAAVARDDLDNLSWFEGLGNALRRAGQGISQSANQYMLNQAAGRFQDRSMSFGQILESERRPTIMGPDGKALGMLPLGPVELFGAMGRYIDARYAEMIGTDDEASAREYAAAVKANIDATKALPKSDAGARSESRMFVDGASPGQTISNIGREIVTSPMDFLAWMTETLTETTPQLVAGAATTAVTRNPNLGVSVSVGSTFGIERYTSPADFLAEKGIDLGNANDVGRLLSEPQLLKEANERGIIRGAVISAFDFLSMGLAGKVLANNPLVEAVAQSVQQSVNGSLGEYFARLGSGQEIDWNEIIAEGLAEIATAPVDMGIAGRKLVDLKRKAREAEVTVRKAAEISAQANASKLRARLPDRFRQFLEGATAGTDIENVFIPAEDFVQYFQGSGIDPFTIASELDGVTRDDLETALAGGGDLKIPTATYAAKIAGTDADPFFMENMRFDPNEFTAREAADFNARADDVLQEAWEAAEAVRMEREELRSMEDQIYDSVVSRLRVAGRSTDVATNEAQLYAAFYRTMAERAGMSTADFMARYPLPEIRGDLPTGMQLKDTDALSRTLAEARNRRAVGAEKRGPTLTEWISDYGGINDAGGELKNMGAETVSRGKGKKSLRLARSGVAAGARDLLGAVTGSGKKHGVDDVARAAIEAGYLANDPTANEYRAAMVEGREVPDIGPALWDAIAAELRGNVQYATEADPAAAEHERMLDEIEGYLSSLGVSLDDDDAKIRQAMEGAREYAQSGNLGPRGLIQFPPAGVGKGDTIIRLFQGADLSTFLHETGHYFLTVMRDMADKGGAPDFEAVKTWWRENAKAVAADGRRVMPDIQITEADVIAALDAGTTGDVLKDAAVDVGMQEQFARGFEAYLMEGKAPSADLRGAFEKFRAWLISVYQKLAGLNVSISADLRNVFDRMIATDEEIANARADTGDSGPAFPTAEQMGMTQEEYDAFLKLRSQSEDESKARLLRETMAPVKRAQEKWFKEERAKVREEVEGQLRLQPVYRASQELRFGKTFDGEEIGVKLDRGMIEKEYGAGYIPFLPGATKDGKGHRNAVFANEGLHPDIVAGMYGFQSGRELLDALTKTPPINEAIEAETDLVMRQRHGDALNDGMIEAEAMDAVHTDKKAQWIAAELKAVVEIAGTGIGMTAKDARASAKSTIARMKVRDGTAAHRFLAAERRAAEEAQRLARTLGREGVWMANARRRIATKARAAVKGKGTVEAVPMQIERAVASSENYNETVAKLIETKRRQLINHALYQEARKTADEVEKITTRAAKLSKSDERLSKSRYIDHVKAARAIAAKFGLARPDSSFDFNAWIEQMRFDDPVTADALTLSIQTYTQDPKHWKDLTVSELGAVSDAMDNVLEAGKRIKSIDIEGKLVDRTEARDALMAILEGRTGQGNKALKAKLTKWDKAKIGALSILSSLRRMEAWTRDMDDGKQGSFTKYLVRPVMDALDAYRADRTKRMAEMLDVINARKGDLFGASITSQELGYTFENKGELLHAILHTGNESNLEKLLMGRGWSNGLIGQTQAKTAAGNLRSTRAGDPIMTRGNVDTSRWDAFINRLVSEGTLTKEDFDTAQSIWDLMESTKRPAQATHKKIFGYYFKEVEPRPLVTPFGTYRGGYVPAIADKDASNDGQIRADQAALEQQQSSFMFPTTGAGFAKSRVENYRTPLSLNLMLLPAHMDKVLRFTHLDPAIRQTASLVNDRELRAAIDNFDKTILPNLVIPWLQRTAQQAVEGQPTTPAGRAASNVFRTIRKRVGLQTMFANIVNSVQQVTGFSSAMVLVKPGLVKSAMVRFTKGGAADMRVEAFSASKFMRERIENASRETQARIQDAITQPTALGDVKLWVERHGYFMQTGIQNVIDVIVWHAAHDQATANGMTDADAVFEADSVIRRAMSAMDPESVSMFETGSSFTRLFTMFYSYFNGQANLVGGEMATAMRTMGWNGSGRMFFIYLFGLAVPAIVGEAIVQAARGDLGDDDDDGYGDDLAELFFGSQIRYLAGTVPAVGPMTMAAINSFNSVPYDDRLSTSPVVSAAERAIRAPASIGSAMFGKGDASRATGDGLTAFGLITGISTGWLVKAGGYAVDVAEGDAKPEGVMDVGRGLVSGRDGTQR